ncbi:hypothetical protein ACJ41P_18485 [Azospirillum argentinense]|uniref:Uncharacterized protein n=1 Tax=Azospirillum argentinense TaxID=2970906 RepID=A0ABW8VCP7_9PROT
MGVHTEVVSSCTVESVCKEVSSNATNLENCNIFVQEVAKKLNSEGLFGGNADNIVARMRKGEPFTKLGTSSDSATKYAADGYLVVGGLESFNMQKKPDNGHVFVVVPGGPSQAGLDTPWTDSNGKPYPSRGGQPYCYHGSKNPKLRTPNRTQVDFLFSRTDEKNVFYAALPVKAEANSKPSIASSDSLLSRMVARLSGALTT